MGKKHKRLKYPSILYGEEPNMIERSCYHGYDDEDSIWYDDSPTLDAQPPPPIIREVSGSRKNQQLSAITTEIKRRCILMVVGQMLMVHKEETGHYATITEPERFVEAELSEETRDKLATKDIKEIVAKVMRAPELQRKYDDLNSHPELINCKNGVISINKWTDKPMLLPHSPEHMFTYVVKACFLEDDETICPTFDMFCETSLDGNPEKRLLFLEMLGYGCCDSNAGKCGLFFKGAPDSGKSKGIEFLTQLFDEDMVSHVTLHKLADRFNIAELFNRKLNIAGEIKGKKLPDITIFKMVTGGDRIQAEFKGKNPFSFKPIVKLVFSGNTIPGTSEAEATKAFVNRLVVLMFNKSIPKKEWDTELLDKLLAERDAIFTLAMEALHSLHRRNYVFTLPQDSAEFLESFATAENPALTFANDCCKKGKECSAFNTDILSEYTQYCDKNGFEPLSRNKLYALLETIPGVRRKKIYKGGEYRHGFTGIEINKKG